MTNAAALESVPAEKDKPVCLPNGRLCWNFFYYNCFITIIKRTSKKIVYGVSIVLNIFFKNGAALSNGSIVSSLNTERT